jgi:hypothetical protein
MIFTVEYRNKGGQKDYLELDVPSKEAVWPELKRRGISAITVREGSRKPQSSRVPTSLWKIIIAGILLLIIGAISLLVTKKISLETVEDKHTPKTVKEATPVKKKATAPINTNKTTRIDFKGSNNLELADKPKSRVVPSTAKKYPRRVIPRRPEPPQRFKYDSDDLIAGFLEIAPGDQVEGGLRFDRIGRDFEKSLLEDVALADGQDTDQNKQIRDWVRETKKEILAVMRSEGKTFAQVMEEQFNQLIELGQYKRDLEQELRQIRKSGEFSADEYDKFIQAANTMLESKGCTPLKVPKATYYQLELYKQRKALKDQNRNNQTTDGGY